MKAELLWLIDEIRGAWRFRWAALAAAFAGGLIGSTVVFALPDRYEAYAQVFVDTRSALKPALQGLTVDQNIDAQINYVHQSLLEGPQLEKIAVATGVLPATPQSERDRARILGKFGDSITLTVASAGSLGDERSKAGTIYGFQCIDMNRDRSLTVVATLVKTFVEETLGGNREGSAQAQEFLETQIKDYARRLSEAEDKLAAFKRRNVGLMPTEQGGYFAQLQAESDKSKKAETDLSIALSRRAELSNQLHSDQALAAAGATAPTTGASGAAANDTMSRIQQAQAHLDELLLKYTDRHPDVIAARATLEELSKRRDAELEKLRRGEATAIASSGAANNPVYQNIQLELNKVDVDIAALRVEVEQHQRSVAELRQRLNSAPQVEAEFQQLNRDYDVNKAQYTALLETYEKARLGERAETAGSVRFEILQPPTAPVGPIWPRRTPLLGVIWLGSLVAGIALAFGLNLLNPTVVSVRMINEITSFPVLGMTGVASPARHRMRTRLRALTLSMAVACWVAAFAGALFLNWSGVRLTIPAIRSLIRT